MSNTLKIAFAAAVFAASATSAFASFSDKASVFSTQRQPVTIEGRNSAAAQPVIINEGFADKAEVMNTQSRTVTIEGRNTLILPQEIVRGQDPAGSNR
jgi:IS1 family transposase